MGGGVGRRESRRLDRVSHGRHLEQRDDAVGKSQAATEESGDSRIGAAEEPAELGVAEAADVLMEQLRLDCAGQIEHAGHPAALRVHAAQVHCAEPGRSTLGQ